MFNQKILIGGLLTLGIVTFGLHKNLTKLPIQKNIELAYVADFSNDRALMGASHNVFVAKIVKQVANKDTDLGPSTQFEAEIVLNVKGSLTGKIVLNQQGGYQDGILYVVEGDTLIPSTGSSTGLLQPGYTYILATRYNAQENWHTFISHPNGVKVISTDPQLSISQLLTTAKADEKVKKLQEAYENEIILEADIVNNNALNSYRDLCKRVLKA